MNEWENQIKKNNESNGVFHGIRFYTKSKNGIKQFVTFQEYLNQEPGFEYAWLTHVGFKININDEYCALGLMTTQEKTNIPSIGLINNIRVNNEFKYVNKLQILDKNTFSKYYTTHDKISELPLYAQQLVKKSKELAIKNAVEAFQMSYKRSILENPIVQGSYFNQLITLNNINVHLDSKHVFLFGNSPYHHLFLKNLKHYYSDISLEE